MLVEFIIVLIYFYLARDLNNNNDLPFFEILSKNKLLDNTAKIENKDINIMTDCIVKNQTLFLKIKIANYNELSKGERNIKLYLFYNNLKIDDNNLLSSNNIQSKKNGKKTLILSTIMEKSVLKCSIPLLAGNKNEQSKIECLLKLVLPKKRCLHIIKKSLDIVELEVNHSNKKISSDICSFITEIKCTNYNIDEKIYFKERILIPPGVTIAFEKFNNCHIIFVKSGNRVSLNQKITNSIIEIRSNKLHIFNDNIVKKEVEIKILETAVNQSSKSIISQITEAGFENSNSKLVKLKSNFNKALHKVSEKVKNELIKKAFFTKDEKRLVLNKLNIFIDRDLDIVSFLELLWQQNQEYFVYLIKPVLLYLRILFRQSC